MKISQLNKQIEKLKKKKDSIISDKHLKCVKCKESTQIKNLTLAVQEYYVEPHGCTGGDYWDEGEYPTYYTECPKCKCNNRHWNEKTAKWKLVNNYRDYFKKEKTICEGDITNWENAT